jgi:hypothetical protein
MITRSTTRMPKREIINIRDRSLYIYYSLMMTRCIKTRSRTKREINKNIRDSLRSLNVYSRIQTRSIGSSNIEFEVPIPIWIVWRISPQVSDPPVTMPKREIIKIRDRSFKSKVFIELRLTLYVQGRRVYQRWGGMVRVVQSSAAGAGVEQRQVLWQQLQE